MAQRYLPPNLTPSKVAIRLQNMRRKRNSYYVGKTLVDLNILACAVALGASGVVIEVV